MSYDTGDMNTGGVYTKTFDPTRTTHNKYFSPDYIANHPVRLSIESLDGKFNSLNTNTIVRGSVKLKQTLCSENYFLWGGFNSSMLQFECCSDDLSLDMDLIHLIRSGPSGRIRLRITPTTDDGSTLDSEAVNLFTGYVEDAEPSKTPGMWKVTAYDRIYRVRNVNISSSIQGYIHAHSAPTWYDIMTLIHKQLGFSDVVYPDNIDILTNTLFPTNADISGHNGIDILREFAFMTQTFGMIDGDGVLRYIRVEKEDGENYYCVNTWDPDRITFSDASVWQPSVFISEPRTNKFYSIGDSDPESTYYSNVFTITNSPILGDDEWIDKLYECDEYGAISSKYSASNLPAGIFDTNQLCIGSGISYYQQEYSISTYADPTIPLGSIIMINKHIDNDYKNLVLSYVMERTITFESTQTILCEMSAQNGPYNTVVPEYDASVRSAARLANEAQAQIPVISDSGTITKLRATKVLSKSEYDALKEKRADTIYYVYDDGGDS